MPGSPHNSTGGSSRPIRRWTGFPSTPAPPTSSQPGIPSTWPCRSTTSGRQHRPRAGPAANRPARAGRPPPPHKPLHDSLLGWIASQDNPREIPVAARRHAAPVRCLVPARRAERAAGALRQPVRRPRRPDAPARRAARHSGTGKAPGPRLCGGHVREHEGQRGPLVTTAGIFKNNAASPPGHLGCGTRDPQRRRAHRLLPPRSPAGPARHAPRAPRLIPTSAQ